MSAWVVVPTVLTADMLNAIRNGYGWQAAHTDMIAARPAGPNVPVLIDANELAELRRDAGRYRFMRDRSNPLERVNTHTRVDNGKSCYHVVGEVRELKHGVALDEAIDAAIAQEKAG